MYHFFAPEGETEAGRIRITGPDVKHITRVLRLGPGDQIMVSDGQDRNRLCVIAETGPDFVLLEILEEAMPSPEMNRRLTLFQGLPKGDKMDYIIEKSVELGIFSLVPVEMARSVMRLDPKKKESRRQRWQAKAESAAKQSRRGLIPEVGAVCSFSEALRQAAALDMILVPYEEAGDMGLTRELLEKVPEGASLGVFIGPEGGFAPEEIEALQQAGARLITLGPRILRTETAGPAFLAMCTLMWEE